MKISTRDAQGNPNGWLLPIWHADSGTRIEQVYLTAIAPYAAKGPHLHMKRRGLFCCIAGSVKIVWRDQAGNYHEAPVGNGDHRLVEIAPGTPAALYNMGSTEALVLNMPSPPWRADDQDEWPVEDWRYQCASI